MTNPPRKAWLTGRTTAKKPYRILAKDHPLGHDFNYSSLKEARAAAQRLANMYGQAVTITHVDKDKRPVSRETYKKNPGIGSYYYHHPESGEKIVHDSLDRAKRGAEKVANRIGRAVHVFDDYWGTRK